MESRPGLTQLTVPSIPNLKYRWLLPGMLGTLLVSLSIHVYLLQVLRTPFPDFEGVSLWARLLSTGLAMFALIVTCIIAQPRLGRCSKVKQCVIVFLLYATLKESLRGILMNGVVTTGWGFDIVSGLPGLTYASS